MFLHERPRMRYFFHVVRPAGIVLDEEGSDCLDLEAARAEASASVRELLADDLRAGRLVEGRHIEIADEHGTTLDRVGLTVAVSK